MSRDPLATVETRLQARLGHATVEDLGVLRRLDFLRFALASGDDAYVARVEALAPDAPAPAPTLFLPGVLHWTAGPAEVELRSDGLATRDAPGVDDEPLNLMHGGQSIAFHRTPTEGMHVHAHRRMQRADRKVGGTAEFLVVTTTTEFREAGGEPLATVDDTILVLSR